MQYKVGIGSVYLIGFVYLSQAGYQNEINDNMI